jgi:hypothetical protein
MERRHAAIVAADVVGYSRLIRTDEDGTLATLTVCKRRHLPSNLSSRDELCRMPGLLQASAAWLGHGLSGSRQ